MSPDTRKALGLKPGEDESVLQRERDAIEKQRDAALIREGYMMALRCVCEEHNKRLGWHQRTLEENIARLVEQAPGEPTPS